MYTSQSACHIPDPNQGDSDTDYTSHVPVLLMFPLDPIQRRPKLDQPQHTDNRAGSGNSSKVYNGELVSERSLVRVPAGVAKKLSSPE